jgi:hypothetical protein
MKKAAKAEQEPVEPTNEVEPKSNVGLDESLVKEELRLSAGDIAMQALLICDTNGVPIKDFMIALKEQLEMLDEDKVAA